MASDVVSSIKTIEELQEYVYETLCSDHDLLTDAFPKSKRVVRRASGEVCGILFTVSGPRSVDFTAIWERTKNRIFFYGPNGERYRQTVLEGAPIVSGELIDSEPALADK